LPARSALLVTVASVVGGSLAGCAAFGGGASTTATTHAGRAGGSKLAQAQRTHEYPGAPRQQGAAGGASSPVLVIEAFATAYINWTAQSVAPTMRALARITVGQARSEVSLTAAQTAQDYELKRGGIANSGVVEAIAPVLGHRDQYAVVTRERTTATNTTAYQGLRPAWHLALATVTPLPGGQWVISSWQPEN
jgi:hypothetical protein